MAARLPAPSRSVSIHPYRNAQTRPNAAPMKLYCPPARGIMALSSANVTAPASVKTPATAYASSTIHGVPTLQVMARALKNTPEPITFVTMRAVAGISVSARTSVRAEPGAVLESDNETPYGFVGGRAPVSAGVPAPAACAWCRLRACAASL